MEPRHGLFDIRGARQRNAIGGALEPIDADPAAERVEHDRADERAEGRGDDHRDQIKRATAGREARERQDQFARNRRKQALDRDEKSGAEHAEGFHDTDGPLVDAHDQRPYWAPHRPTVRRSWADRHHRRRPRDRRPRARGHSGRHPCAARARCGHPPPDRRSRASRG